MLVGECNVPYDGLYQVTMVFQGDNDMSLMFRILIDGYAEAFAKQFDSTHQENTIILTRNFHLWAGQIVAADYGEVDGIYASSNEVIGYESWFHIHLIIPD